MNAVASLINPTNEERVNLAHNLKTFMEVTGKSIESLRKSKGADKQVPWMTIKNMLDQNKLQYRDSTLARVAHLLGVPAKDVLKPQELVATNPPKANTKPVSVVKSAKAGTKAVTVAGTTKPAAKASTGKGKKEFPVRAHPRKQRIGVGHSKVKNVVVQGHLKTRSANGIPTGTSLVSIPKVHAVAKVPAANSVLIGVGKDAIHLPLSRLKSMVTNDDGTLTITLLP